MLKKKIFRGYIFSRRIENSIIPQRVQNLVIKDYCERNNLFFKPELEKRGNAKEREEGERRGNEKRKKRKKKKK